MHSNKTVTQPQPEWLYRVVQPPSTRMVWPGTYWLASLASHRTAPVKSSGVPWRGRGGVAAEPVQGAFLGVEAVGDLAAEEAGDADVAADRGHVDDRPASGGAHVRKDVLGQAERRDQVEVKGLPDRFEWLVLGRPGGETVAGHVDQDLRGAEAYREALA
jgi:hypothetical protein